MEIDDQYATHAVTLERLNFELHGGEGDGIGLTRFCHTNCQDITLATASTQYVTASHVVQDRMNGFHLDTLSCACKFRG